LSHNKIRVAVVGVGEFGRNHARVWRENEDTELVGVMDQDAEQARRVAEEFGTRALPDLAAVAQEAQAVSLAVPTIEHSHLGCQLLESGLDVLVEKPIASSVAEADALIAAAERKGRLLQIGHLERFNPAIVALQDLIRRPLFFEVHRLGIFAPRSLDIDVVYDVMIHDLDILLALVGAPVIDARSVGIAVLTEKIDIAHSRLEFSTGAVANLTASRVSTERVRKLRFFQEHEYISADYTRQDVLRVRVQPDGASFGFEKIATQNEEPLRAELRSFLECVRTRRAPRVDGHAGRQALQLADLVMDGIREHARRISAAAMSRTDTRPNSQ
jgi:predicted dehydrogenase